MSAPKAPFVVRWRNGLMDDDNPVLTWRAMVAAMALVRYADVATGHNCYPGAKKCASNMRVSESTIHRGWDELVAAGWLEIKPLPESRRRTQGALKILRWPPSTTCHPTDGMSDGHVIPQDPTCRPTDGQPLHGTRGLRGLRPLRPRMDI